MPQGVLPRPPERYLRNMCKRYEIWSTAFTLAAGVAVCVAWHVFYMNPKNKKYDDFFRNLDPYKELERMCKKNLLHTCPQNLAKLAEEKGIPVPKYTPQ